MSRSDDPDHFFQTTDSIAERSRKAAKASSNKNGSPIRIPSKILALIADPLSAEHVFVAESASTARRICLDVSIKLAPAYTGPAAPLTSLAISNPEGPNSKRTLYAGCWDHTIWSWDASTRKPGLRFRNGHRDFVKTLLLIQIPKKSSSSSPSGASLEKDDKEPVHLLVSGGADAKILLWDALTGDRLKVLDGHVRGVLALALDPVTLREEAVELVRETALAGDESDSAATDGTAATDTDHPLVLFSASSDKEIKRWKIWMRKQQRRPDLNLAAAAATHEHKPLPSSSSPLCVSAAADPFSEDWASPHPTSVYALCFAPDFSGDEETGPDLWTASADGTVKCLSRSRGWTEDTVLDHNTNLSSSGSGSGRTNNNVVRAITLTPDGGRYVVSGGRDEDVWVWDSGSGKCLQKWVGHADEVTGLCVVLLEKRMTVVSASLDGTVRTWVLDSENFGTRWDGESVRDGEGEGEDETKKTTGIELTAEEEAELAELAELDDDDDDDG